MLKLYLPVKEYCPPYWWVLRLLGGSYMDIQTWKSKNIGVKGYAHFDRRVSIDQVWNYITTPQNIVHHGFYPFIHYQKHFNKYSKQNGIKTKERELCYSAHIDRCIFQYYSFLLNQKYNKRVEADGFSDSAVAYRDNLKKNNIHFAKQAVDFIKNQKECYIIVGDFTHFFDSLDHKYLKKQLCDLLNCKKLPEDYYAIFKNITKYSMWDLKSLLELNSLPDTPEGIKALNDKERVLPLHQFKAIKSKYITPHRETYGIPQGSAISAVLSNIYMLEFDKKMRQYVDSQYGLYMRYSDDFIVVLPQSSKNNFSLQLSYIQDIIKSISNLDLQPEKTQLFYYSNFILENCNTDFLGNVQKGKNLLNYLGFTFDGKNITIRDKTLSKYYYRMYRKIRTIVKNNGYTPKGNKINCTKLYLKYSEKGAQKGNGNFLTYVHRAEFIFGKNEAIARGTRHHMQKIRKHLDLIKNHV